MDYFTRGTTPDFRFEVNEDLTDWDVYVTFGQRKKDIATVHPPSIEIVDGKCFVFGRLTQEQTLEFKEGAGHAQIRAYKNGAAGATGYMDFEVKEIILPGTIPKEVGE